ncbi:hypothetical protein M1563_00555 [Patescibacteria group bacterium]|nr:hypothetical protein [Patescibacteria group bacterium]MCL5409390.1 hypothetical protein [Patescibacteria group bacterium]
MQPIETHPDALQTFCHTESLSDAQLKELTIAHPEIEASTTRSDIRPFVGALAALALLVPVSQELPKIFQIVEQIFKH